jgi:hypothetical protein
MARRRGREVQEKEIKLIGPYMVLGVWWVDHRTYRSAGERDEEDKEGNIWEENRQNNMRD